jgi:hypothetical protein
MDLSQRANGLTLFHRCCAAPFDTERRKLSAMRLLLKHGADPHETCYFGNSPLHLVLLASQFRLNFEFGYFRSSSELHVMEALDILLESGVNYRSSNNDGITPGELAYHLNLGTLWHQALSRHDHKMGEPAVEEPQQVWKTAESRRRYSNFRIAFEHRGFCPRDGSCSQERHRIWLGAPCYFWSHVFTNPRYVDPKTGLWVHVSQLDAREA